MTTKISELPEGITLTEADLLAMAQGGSTRKVTVSAVLDLLAEKQGWSTVLATKYTATPAGITTITMSDTSDIIEGRPIRIQQNSAFLYAYVLSVTENTSIAIGGISMNASQPITQIAIGASGLFEHMELGAPGKYADATGTQLIRDFAKTYTRWFLGPAYLVNVRMTHGKIADSGSPRINVLFNNARTLTANSGAGLQLSNIGSSVYSASNGIDSTYYKIEPNTRVELECTQAATNAENLTVSLLLVRETL